MNRVSRLSEIGLIRQINAIFDTRRLGYKSALVALEARADKLDRVAQEINKHPGVSHNYERNHQFNMWFTLAVPPDADLKAELERLASIEGVKKYRVLPTLKVFKIGVRLDMVNEDNKTPDPTDEVKTLNLQKFFLTERDKDFIRELQKNLEIIPEPFKDMAIKLGITTSQLFAKAREYEQLGIMRRFAAILRHRDAGFAANGMVVWKVPSSEIENLGCKLAAFPQVSHCYQRPVYPDWPFNLFSMIHARSVESAEEMANHMSDSIGIKEYRILFSLREFKKERVRYFEDN